MHKQDSKNQKNNDQAENQTPIYSNGVTKVKTDSMSGTTKSAQLQGIADAYVDKRHPVNSESIQKKANNTGLPDQLKAGIENLSGYSMDDVKVHYNSDKPAQLQAHAYAQGNQIHLAPGQEKHLPHEAWHVVQQKQGRVKPTKQLKAKVNINDDEGLEKEADVMGARAKQLKNIEPHKNNNNLNSNNNPIAPSNTDLVQRAVVNTPPAFVFDRNVAVAWKGGGAYADTPSVINGHEIPPLANKEGMILEPRLAQVGEVWRTMPETQHIGSRIEAPEAGPWTFPNQVGLDELDAFARNGGYLTPDRSPLEESHTYTLIVRGFPDDATLHQAILTHELHHVAEQDDIINDVLIPWDDQVTAQNASAGDPLNAGLAYDALGIPKAQEIANEIASELRRQGLAFHETEAGKEPDIANVVLDEPNATYTVYLTPHA